jgi:hypothetical protein
MRMHPLGAQEGPVGGQGASWHQLQLCGAATVGILLRAQHCALLGSSVPKKSVRFKACLLYRLAIHPARQSTSVTSITFA